MEDVSAIFRNHYKNVFLEHGMNSKGVDWGNKEWATVIRHKKMLEIIKENASNKITLLDVGCGYGALLDTIIEKQLNISYTGVDVVDEMIIAARKKHPEVKFITGDILNVNLEKYDYIVCNGIMTQKLNVSITEMNKYVQKLIQRMFALCNKGVVFNVMNTYVNYQKDNLYYRNPSELLAWCMSEITPSIKIDCSYELWYEYTAYLYKHNNDKELR